jgi:lipopolysaccharide export system permease protein
MQTLRRLIHREMLVTVAFVALAFLALFSFFDLVEELGNVGKGVASSPYQLSHAALFVLLWMPSRLYEVLPIAVLIGSITVMARFAQSSEFTILRTSGMDPWRALRTLLSLGAVFTLATFLIGDYIAPASTRTAQLLKARFLGQITVGQTGAWLKEKQQFSNFAVNVGTLTDANSMRNIRVFEFNSRGFLVSSMTAESGDFAEDAAWTLQGVKRTEFIISSDTAGTATTAPTLNASPPNSSLPNLSLPNLSLPNSSLPSAKVQHDTIAKDYRWPTELSAEMVSVALLKPERMGTLDLFQYMNHLQANGQTSQRYEIEFWRKVFYPLSCLVMVVLALPFAYLHFRSSSISGYVFGGVMIGISFFLLNNVFGYAGNLNNWKPWIAAAIPGLLYSIASLGAFTWLVLRR